MVKAAGMDVTHGLLPAAKQLLREAAAPEAAVGNVAPTSADANPEELEGEMRVGWTASDGGFIVWLNGETERWLISARELDECLEGWHAMALVTLMR
jgi:hypothetical protein